MCSRLSAAMRLHIARRVGEDRKSSLKRSNDGGSPGPVWHCAVNSRHSWLGVLPLTPAQLQIAPRRPASMRFEGTLKSWNDERGFGFIEPTQGGQDIFVHIKAFGSRSGRPQLNQLVSFEVELGPQGKKRAKSVEPVRAARSLSHRRHESPAQWGTATLFAIPAFVIIYGAVSMMWRPPLILAAIYAGVSVFTFFAYAWDKSAASRGAWRTPESTLHALALVCGWPGALLAQQLLRHKSTKTEFRSVFWGTVVLNVVAFAVLSSPMGRSLWAEQ